MNEEYFILVDGEQTGPYTFDELIEKEPDLHTRVMAPSADTWQDACDVPELFEYFREQGYYFPTEDNLASYWWRLLAFIIDFVLMSFVLSFLVPLLNAKGITHINLAPPFDPYKISIHDATIIQAVFYILLLFYNAIGEASAMKGTLGKRVCGLVVVDQDGDGLNLGMALFRSLGKILSIYLWGLGTFSIFWTDGKQALHDFLAKTYVVRKNV
ncbi:RDD family protein [Mucilaginibacter sp.]|uniref:RDD family protein n=1 Tax=Mucilaginibacter sp. TaxID=1882438 RepID=UPI00284C8C16|nr:RDD family protein [Mucilaginibacter sp.]MDR3694622.1 RDD family protein [Mucilaginibacter sp.]